MTNVNDPPTGSVTISGTASKDQVLTVSNTLADADGLGAISYQWQRDGVDVAGATGGTYTLGNADVGHAIVGGRGGNDTLTGGSGADTFIYADGGGADFVTDFNRSQGDTIDLTGVLGIVTFADVQSKATLSGGSTVLNFGGGNTLTLTGVASLQQGDFVLSVAINGTSGSDVLLGTNQTEQISALAGNDRLQGSGGNDILDGGPDFDRAVYTDATRGITVNLAHAGTASGLKASAPTRSLLSKA